MSNQSELLLQSIHSLEKDPRISEIRTLLNSIPGAEAAAEAVENAKEAENINYNLYMKNRDKVESPKKDEIDLANYICYTLENLIHTISVKGKTHEQYLLEKIQKLINVVDIIDNLLDITFKSDSPK